ncbi:hypothetical protein ACFW3E_21865, partial [Streptomyces sp. NPDC058861]
MKHHVRKRPEGRFQCLKCRAAFQTEEAARRAQFPCPGDRIAHGLTREHLVYPRDLDRSCDAWNCPEPDPSHAWHGPDPYCDELGCDLCCHACDCGVCEGHIHAPGLCVLDDIPDWARALTTRRRKKETMSATTTEPTLKTGARPVGEINEGDHVIAPGRDTRGHNVKRTGIVLRTPEHVTVQRDGVRTRVVRLHVGEAGEQPTRSNSVTLLPDALVYREKAPATPAEADVPAEEPQDIPWKDDEFRACVGMTFLFGGKAGKANPKPTTRALVRAAYTSGGRYELRHVETDETVAVVRLQSRIWWADEPAPVEEPAPEAPTPDDSAEHPKPLVIVACGGKKSQAPGRIPAEQRYTGPYFRACLKAAKAMDGLTLILAYAGSDLSLLRSPRVEERDGSAGVAGVLHP